jgi:antitoxin (DNA-binding transcriptional repressor) of toxin-antitoxin stability system
MSTSAARNDDAPAATPSHPSRERHLRVVPDQFANDTAAASGSPLEAVFTTFALGVLVSDVAQGHFDPDAWADVLSDAGNRTDVRRVAELLAANFRVVADELRSLDGAEVPSSEMRTQWSANLERVRDGGELLYVTHHGDRVAALVPPHVADYYRAAEDKVDAEAIDQALTDREAGDEPISFDDLAAELGL